MHGTGRNDAVGPNDFLQSHCNGNAVGALAEYWRTLGVEKSHRIELLIAVEIGDVATTRRR